MGNILQIPSADFSKNPMRKVRTQKIVFDDADKVGGALEYSNSNIMFMTSSNQPLPSTYEAYNKYSSPSERSTAPYFDNYYTYVIDIPINAIAIGGITQILVNKKSNSGTARYHTSFGASSGLIEKDTYSITRAKNDIGFDDDDWKTVFNMVANYNFTNNSSIKFFKYLDVYDSPVCNVNDTQSWGIGLFEIVMLIPEGATLFNQTIVPPVRKQNRTLENRMTSTFNVGMTESHLYWIFE